MRGDWENGERRYGRKGEVRRKRGGGGQSRDLRARWNLNQATAEYHCLYIVRKNDMPGQLWACSCISFYRESCVSTGNCVGNCVGIKVGIV